MSGPIQRSRPETEASEGADQAKPAEDPHDNAVFRVVTHDGARQAFKLEGIFWKVLHFAANRNKQRIGAYIAGVLDQKDKSANKSSVLRVHAAEWLSIRLLELRSHSLNPAVAANIVKAMPFPSLMVDMNHKLVAQNQPFLTLLSNLIGAHDAGEPPVVRIRLGSDMDAIRKELKESDQPYLDDGVHIECESKMTRLSARLVGLKSADGGVSRVLVFLTE